MDYTRYRGIKENHKKIGKLVLETLIERKKRQGIQTAALRAIAAQYPGIPVQEIDKYLKS